ncbi:hypothetical protein EDC65_2160 [Stella humosa]|uniref:Uncharacterized protein n=1 Tax=Stella humosa TaxID=94 RepID=A0A3N1LYR0_9PROT|nr:hypothetical protein [Stella humosa]ROQ00364.1 hypothetical protein EDC65_2160 [Stella humosa]BBK30397.1 hypothetical protein STHU_10310 [Stella humosa]
MERYFQYQVVSAFAALEMREPVNATKIRLLGTSPVFYRQDDVSPARILR